LFSAAERFVFCLLSALVFARAGSILMFQFITVSFWLERLLPVDFVSNLTEVPRRCSQLKSFGCFAIDRASANSHALASLRTAKLSSQSAVVSFLAILQLVRRLQTYLEKSI
jgi:hypothetical protein